MRVAYIIHHQIIFLNHTNRVLLGRRMFSFSHFKSQNFKMASPVSCWECLENGGEDFNSYGKGYWRSQIAFVSMCYQCVYCCRGLNSVVSSVMFGLGCSLRSILHTSEPCTAADSLFDKNFDYVGSADKQKITLKNVKSSKRKHRQALQTQKVAEYYPARRLEYLIAALFLGRIYNSHLVNARRDGFFAARPTKIRRKGKSKLIPETQNIARLLQV